MASFGQYFTGAVLGALTAVGIVWGLGFLDGAPPLVIEQPVGEQPGDVGAVAPAHGNAATVGREDRTQLTRIEARLADLEDGIRSLDRKIDALSTESPTRTPIPTGPSRVVIDEEAIARAMERVEERKLSALSLDDLMMQSKRQLKLQDFVAARRTLEALLARAQEPEDRAFALTQLGVLHRSNGDLKESVRVLEGAVREFGVDTEHGRGAAYQLLWTRCKAGEHTAAAQLSRTLANSPNVPEMMRVNARWAGAIVAEASGDANGARAAYQAILSDYGNRPEHRKLVEDVRRRLESMR